MTKGRFIVILLLTCALVAGASLYYLQVYAYYQAVTPQPGQDVQIVVRDTETTATIPYGDFQAIDADSSPIRYRACFTTTEPLERLRETFVVVASATPRNAPGWFECFDAESIARDLQAGTATAFLSIKNVHYGVDRITAISSDGHGYVWHELNDCGTKAYDGTVVGEECPPRPAPES